MAVVENLDLNLRAKIGDLQAKLVTAGQSVVTFKQTVINQGTQATKGFQTSMSGIAGMAARYLGPLAIAAGVGWGVSLAAQSEKAMVGFSTMLGSADKARALLGELKQFGASTPFEFPELRQAAQSLLSFGVPLGSVMNRLKTLGDVAAGSGSDIKDLSLIFGKTLAKGKFELEQGNQLAERGIPIYSTLAKQLGVSQAELMKMISAGKVSAGAVQTAFETMAASGGIFDNAMAKQSTTLLGMWSTLIDNITSIATSVGQFFVEAFGLKDILAGFISFSGSVSSTMDYLMPVATAVKGVFVASFNAIGAALQWLGSLFMPILQPVIDWLGNTFGTTLQDLAITAISVFAQIEFAITNFSRIWNLGFDIAFLKLISFENFIAHIFTKVIPTIFNNFGSATLQFFDSLGSNIGETIAEIWAFIASGGTDEIELHFKPLIMDEIVQSFHRELTDAEKQLAQGIKTQKESLQSDLGAFVNGKVDEFMKIGLEEKDKLEGDIPTQDKPAEQKSKKDQTAKALEKGSMAAFSAINGINRSNDPTVKAINEGNKLTKDNNKQLKAIEKNTGIQLQPAAL